MILDSNLILSDAQAPTTVGTHVSDNVIDIVEVGDAINELYFVAMVETACAGTGATVTVEMITSDAEDLSDPDVLWSSGAIAVANLVDQYCFGIVRLPKPEKVKRYLGAQIIIGTAALTAGAFDIFLTDNPQTNISG